MPEMLIGLLLGCPCLGGIWSGVFGRNAIETRSPVGLAWGAMLQIGVVVWWLLTPAEPVTVAWPLSWLSPSAESITFTLDQTRALALLTMAGVVWVIAWSPSQIPWSTLSRAGGWWLLGLANLFWLSDDLMVSWLAQTALLGGGCLLLGWSSEGTAGAPSARQLWITITCGDGLLWSLSLWWFAEFGSTQWSAPTQSPAWQDFVASSPAIVTAMGLAIWCGTLARGWQFPLGLTCDSATEFPGRALGLLFGLVLAPVGWRWLSAGVPVFWHSPECYHLIQGAAMLSACLSAWFSLCSVDPRVRVAWLAGWQWSFVIAALLVHEDWGVNLSGLVGASGLLTSVALLGLWTTGTPADRDAASRPFSADDRTEEPVIATFTNWRSGTRHAFHWTTVTQHLKAHWPGFEPMSRQTDAAGNVVAIGGRGTVFCASCLLAVGPMLVTAWAPVDGFRQTTTDAPFLSLFPLLALCGGVWALTRLVLTTIAAEAHASGKHWRHVTLTPLLPWIFVGLTQGSLFPVGTLQVTAQLLAMVVAVGAGIVLGLLGNGREAVRTRGSLWETFERLGRRRLYVPQLWLLGLNLPLRAGAQLARFLDWFVIDGVLLNGMSSLARWESRSSDDLQNRDPGFYALTVGLGAVSVTITLMWLAQ